MRYLALCTDYDGTLATEGRVMPETVAALKRLIASGRRLVLVTGRELDDLKSVCQCLGLFEFVVAENGALLYEPSTGAETPLADRPPESFIAALRARGVGPISVGRVIVATWEPHETSVLETIRDQGLELQVIFNKGAVMVLPAGVNKATGLKAALQRMGLSPHNAVGIGDAENDHALLKLCECAVAVANALPTLKEAADYVTNDDRGAGVVELIDALLKDDLAAHETALVRHHLLLGLDPSDREIRLRPYGENVLLAGPAGSGKSAFASGLLERLTAAGYTFCAIDGVGRYPALCEAVSLGTAARPPQAPEILNLFRGPGQSAVVRLIGLPAAQRASFFHNLIPGLDRLRQRVGRPHWLVADRGSPSEWPTGEARGGRQSVLHIAERADALDASSRESLSLVLGTGDHPEFVIEQFCQLRGLIPPHMDPQRGHRGEALAWRPQERGAAPFRLRLPSSPGQPIRQGDDPLANESRPRANPRV